MKNGPGKKVIGYGWCGTYCAPQGPYRLGWLMPPFVAHKQSETLSADQRKALGMDKSLRFAYSDMYRVRITIEPMKNKRGQYIVRRTKRPDLA